MVATRIGAGLLSLLLASALPGCGPMEERVGERVITWHESEDGVPLDATRIERDIVIVDEEGWERWTAALPPDLVEGRADELAEVDIDNAVLVVTHLLECDNTSRLLHLGDGELDHVAPANQDPPVACETSPGVLEVWRIGLEDLGVDAASVTIG